MTGPTGQVLDEGEGRAEVADGALVVSPVLGQPLRVRPAEITSVAEPEPYSVRITLVDGATVDLWELGRMRTQLLGELGEQRSADLTGSLLLVGVGRPDVFPGALDGVDAELRLYDDALVVIPASGEPEQVPYAFVADVRTDASGYRIEVVVPGRPALVLQGLARRTTEFLDQLRARVTAARGRTSAFLGALLPGLGSLALRSVAGLLRDGMAARRTDLDAVDPTVWPALLAAATLPDRRPAAELLSGLGEVWVGFKQQVSVRQQAQGVTAWTDHSVEPTFDHDRSTGGLGTGMSGMLTAGMLADGPGALAAGFEGAFGGPMGGLLALNMLGLTTGSTGRVPGGPGGAGAQPAMLPPADVTRGMLLPDRADLSALTASGERPTVLAFLFAAGGDHVAYEVLNEPDHATYLYRGTSSDVPALNRAMALLGFRVEAVYTEASGAGSRYHQAVARLDYLQALRSAFVGRATHTDGWADRVRELLAS